jgi:hypothetical protein
MSSTDIIAIKKEGVPLSEAGIKFRSLAHVLWACLFVLSMVLFSWASSYAAEVTEFAQLEIMAKDGAQYNAMQLLDGRYTTKLDISGNAEIKIESPDKISGLYIIWDQPPGDWSLQVDEAIALPCIFTGKRIFCMSIFR